MVRSFFLGLGLLVGLQAWASPELGLRRAYEGSIEINQNLPLTLSFLTQAEGRFYYQAYLGDEPDALAEFTPREDGSVQIRVLRPTKRLVYTFFLGSTDLNVLSTAVIEFQKAGTDMEDSDSGAVYWVKFSGAARPLDTAVRLNLKTSLWTDQRGQQALGEIRATGPLTYSACDGCEHGDKLMVTNRLTGLEVNVAYLPLAPYYVLDCEGQVHRWLTQLMDLGVPFTFVGRISALTTDLRDDGHWVAAPSGKLYIGTEAKPEHELSAFFAKLPWTDGDFDRYSGGQVGFSAGGGEVTYLYEVGP